MAKKVYIAGKISGDAGYQVKFMRARAQLMKDGSEANNYIGKARYCLFARN